MLINIDFSIFYSPTKAYGSVTGKIDVPASTKVGDKILVLRGGSATTFDGWLRVTSISPMTVGQLVMGLDDLVVSSMNDANTLSRELTSAGLFVDPYQT